MQPVMSAKRHTSPITIETSINQSLRLRTIQLPAGRFGIQLKVKLLLLKSNKPVIKTNVNFIGRDRMGWDRMSMMTIGEEQQKEMTTYRFSVLTSHHTFRFRSSCNIGYMPLSLPQKPTLYLHHNENV